MYQEVLAEWLYKDIYLITPVVSRGYVNGIESVRKWATAVECPISSVGVSTADPRISINLILAGKLI
jgi:hypothetical protein